MKNKIYKKNLRGAVSLFVVIFFSLLITVVVVGFVRIALKDQQAATALNLSQSAYDSAQAGVEDAKRAIIRLNNICNTASASYSAALCSTTTSLIDSINPGCFDAVNSIATPVSGEVKIQQSTGDTVSAALDQAYTCVTITRNTVDFVGKLTADESKVIKLKGESAFNKIQIEWFNTKNLPTNSTTIDLQPYTNLPTTFPSNRPPVMRAHLIQTGPTFSADNMNNTATNSSLFLYPVTGSTSTLSFAIDAPQTPTKQPSVVGCKNSLASGGYSCTVILNLPLPLGGTVANREALLDLKALYNSTDYRVTLWMDAAQVKFNNVQPMVDSTGRANSLFRRVQSRLELVDAYSYPSSAVEISGNFCKDFSVTDQIGDYQNNCTP